jgi:hypothetical protein
MKGTILPRVRAFLVRGLAVVAVVLTYALGSAAIQVASVVGVSTLALTTTATPAHAWFRRRVFFAPRRRFFFVPRRRFVRHSFFFAPRRRFVRRRWW